ncbi:MAG: lytic transglycosylase domain-containing protein [Campylobacter sp.]|nr:lytic transglycosylase domain-containing protein [Campylobacter sp.]
MLKVAVLILTSVSFLSAGILSYEELKNRPNSLVKDYYIHRLATEGSVSNDELKNLRKDVYRDKGKLKTVLDKRVGQKPVYDPCKGVYAGNILDANLTCKLKRMTPNFISLLSEDTKSKLIDELAEFLDEVNLLKGMSKANPAEYFADTNNIKNFFNYYKSLNDTKKSQMFNFALSSEFAKELGAQSYFTTFITNSVVNKNHTNLRRSLIGMNPVNTSSQGAFYLGINAVKFGSDDESVKFFKHAAENAKTKEEKDRANFWLYLVASSQDALLKVAKSSDLNLYSLYAKELTGNTNLNVVIPTPSKESVLGYDPNDPFSWVELKERVKNTAVENLGELARKFETKSTLGEYIYIQNIIDNYSDNFYPMPFIEIIGSKERSRQALIFAIARQESRFIQSAVSISYALGMMQFMPFVANDWASRRDFGNFDQDDMFKPEVSYKMANIHLDWLEDTLWNPVFIAYAYNGGIGFTKKLITRGDLFNPGKYEPFLSMELVDYAESREYAKRVLANYIVYSQVLDKNANVSIIELVNNLLEPAKTDKYR